MRRALTILVGTAALLSFVVVPAEAASSDKSALIGREYLTKLLAGTDSATKASAAKLAAPGTFAANYAVHQLALFEAERDAGQPSQEKTSIKTKPNNVVDVCSGDNECTPYSDFKLKGKKLASFTINGEDPASRLVIGTGQGGASAGADVKLISAYQSATNHLFVVLEATAIGAPVDVGAHSAQYIDPTGRQIKVAYAAGPTSEIQPGARAKLALLFQDTTVGGKLVVPVFGNAPTYTSGQIEIAI